MSLPPTIRRATKADLPAVARLAAQLVRFHSSLDPARFFREEPIEPGYERWLRREIDDPEVVLLVAEQAGDGGAPAIVGYTYGRLEGRDWNALLDACGRLHDVYVVEEARKGGVGAALVLATVKHLQELGAPRVLLDTASQNAAAQRLFAKLGFRPTMVEMTRDLP